MRGVRVYSFHIDPTASLGKRRRRSGKSASIFAPDRILSALKTFFPGKGLQPVAKTMPQPSRMPRAEPAAVSRKETMAARRTAKEIIAARQMRYGNYAISTSQLADGRWTASFGRQDGGLIRVDGKSQPVSVTGPYFAETVAIATAQTRIDALAADEKAHTA
jgi:hypothetical protein